MLHPIKDGFPDILYINYDKLWNNDYNLFCIIFDFLDN